MLTVAEKAISANYSQKAAGRAWHAGSDQGLKALTRAVIIQACRDARQDDYTAQEARRWLMGEDCAEMAGFVGLDHNVIAGWVRAGCPRNTHRRKDSGNV